VATNITKQELLKVARSSAVKVYDHEAEQLVHSLDAVLTYAARVKDVARDVAVASDKNVNIMREDVMVQGNSDPILAQAPEHEEHYFIVPSIIEK
jgi:aspartyl-tRNA(Asn)/glutamyl-tRNA(Gln) amidotransferase subunit C